MRSRRVMLGALKWCLVAVAAVCVGLGVVTSRWFIEWRSPDMSRDTGVLAWKGMVSISWGPALGDFNLWEPPLGFSMGRTRSPLWPMDPWRWKPQWETGPYGCGVNLPLWLATLAPLMGALPLHLIGHRAAKRAR